MFGKFRQTLFQSAVNLGLFSDLELSVWDYFDEPYDFASTVDSFQDVFASKFKGQCSKK